jgi:hypothetical protein
LGLPLVGYFKFTLLLLAAIVNVAPAWAQSPSVETDEPEISSACPDPAYGNCPLFRFHDWMCGHPLRSLVAGRAADTREVPWADWSESPISVGAFAGAMNGGPLVNDWVGTSAGFDGGWRIGWDVTPSWAAEMRFAFATLPMYDSYRAKLAQLNMDNAAGMSSDDPLRTRFEYRNAELFQWDVDVVYYPWRETRLRPYILAGIGLTDVNYGDRTGQTNNVACLSLPLGIGLKYLCDENLAVRLDLIDDIAMSNEHLETQNNLSLTAGLELRFGGSRKVYWPFDLSR